MLLPVWRRVVWFFPPRLWRITYHCTPASCRTPSCGVYDHLRQSLSLFTALSCITLEMTVLRYLGYDADAGWLYLYLYILFFVVCDDGMTRNKLQDNGAYPRLGELMESKIK